MKYFKCDECEFKPCFFAESDVLSLEDGCVLSDKCSWQEINKDQFFREVE